MGWIRPKRMQLSLEKALAIHMEAERRYCSFVAFELKNLVELKSNGGGFLHLRSAPCNALYHKMLCTIKDLHSREFH